MFFGQKDSQLIFSYADGRWATIQKIIIIKIIEYPNKIIMNKKRRTIDFRGLVILTFFFSSY
jgi:hypothetical protein